MKYGIDVSEWQDELDWEEIRDAGVEFAIVRCTRGKNGIDEMFLNHVNGAHEAGLLCGAYHYSYALTVDDAVKEAQHCKNVIEDAGVLLELPVWFDMEDADGYKRENAFAFTMGNVTAICKAFLNEIKPLDCGVYASLSWLQDYIDWPSLGCAVWNAEWMRGENPTPNIDQDSLQGYMWQYTDKKLIGGRYFDGDVAYI